jgi:hypothetical protein
MFVLPTMRDAAKRSMRRERRPPTERLGVPAVETGVVAARRFPRRPFRRDAQGRNGSFLHWTDRRGRIDWTLASAHFQTIASEIDRTCGPSGFP